MAMGLVSDLDLQKELTSLGITEGVSTGVSIDTPASPDTSHDNDKSEGSASLIEEKTNLIVEMKNRGRSKGDVNIPDSLRQLIASTALMEGRSAALELAKEFGISPSSVSAYTNGATSTASYDEPKKSIVEHINKTKETAVKRAARTLSGALKAITQEKLDYTDADKLAGIAKDMSAIIKNLEPQKVPEDASGARTPQFVIFAPQFRDERTFESIVVPE